MTPFYLFILVTSYGYRSCGQSGEYAGWSPEQFAQCGGTEQFCSSCLSCPQRAHTVARLQVSLPWPYFRIQNIAKD